MLIDQLPELNSLNDTDEVPVERGTTSYKAKISTWLSKLAGSFVRKIGDTMTGALGIDAPSTVSTDFTAFKTRNNRFDITTPNAPSPTANIYTRLRFSDAQDSSCADISHRCTTTSRSDLILRASNYLTDGTRVDTTALMSVDKNGNPAVQLSAPEAWLTALNGGMYYTATVANIATAASGCEITLAQYEQWGMIAQLRLTITKAEASSGTITIATLATGKRPKMNSPAQVSWGNGSLGGLVGASGAVQVNGALTAGQSISLMAVYMLA